MNRHFFAVAAVALAAGPAAAVQVIGLSADPGTSVEVAGSGPGLLQADYVFGRQGSVTLDLLVEAGDEGGIGFDSVVGVDSGILLGQNLKALTLALRGGPVFSAIGTVSAAFSEPEIHGGAGSPRILIRFRPDGEGAGILLGNIFGGTDGDFFLSVAGLKPGDGFHLIVSGIVPEAATWAMLIAGFGLVGSRVRQQRRAIAS